MRRGFEKRRSGRKDLKPRDVKITFHDLPYRGVVENMSIHGLFLITVSWEHVPLFVPEAVFELEMQTEQDEKAKLLCEVRWVHINRTPFYGFTYRMGVDIIPHSSGYDDYLFNLSKTTSLTGNG